MKQIRPEVGNKSWKQPVPTNLIKYCNNDYFAATVLMILLVRAANSDTTKYLENGTQVPLKRGQAICGRYELARCCGLKTKKYGSNKDESGRITRVLLKLESLYKQIKRKKWKDCTIVTIMNYEEFVKMTSESTDQHTNNSNSSKQTTDTNKIGKSTQDTLTIYNAVESSGGGSTAILYELLDLFARSNYSYKTLKRTKQQVDAIKYLLEEYGYENTKLLIIFATITHNELEEKSRGCYKQVCQKQTNTPVQLLHNLTQMVKHYHHHFRFHDGKLQVHRQNILPYEEEYIQE